MVAAVALNAKDLTRIVGAARLGIAMIELPMEDRAEEVEFASTLPAHALRNLFKHSEVHLNVEWRDLTTLQWTFNVGAGAGKTLEVSNTPCLRAKFILDHSILLNAGGSTSDFPSDMMTNQRV